MLSGILVLDKPKKISSGDYVRKLKKYLTKEKIGHAGTLDPMATGILIACIGQMTRFSDYLANLPKSYEAEILLGQQTNTGDIQGEVIERTNFIPSSDELKKFLNVLLEKLIKYPLFIQL